MNHPADRIAEAETLFLRAGRLTADEAALLAEKAGVDVERLMRLLLPAARGRALPRVSGFSVGAIAAGDSGALYAGANCEFPGEPLGRAVHAEQAAVAAALIGGERGVERLAVTAAPCGVCRQFLWELASADRLQVIREDGAAARMADLLPGAFGPRDLQVEGALLGATENEIELPPDALGPAASAALAAARRSYAPYTGRWAGVGLIGGDGRAFAGAAIENAAFGPSLTAMQAALAAAASCGEEGSGIEAAAIFSANEGAADQAADAQRLLSRVAPHVALTVYAAP